MTSSPDTGAPRVSVLIATRDRPEALRRCLTSVARQDCPAVEVLVLDDASAEPLDEEDLRQAAGGHTLRCFRSEERCGPIGSRNTLFTRARGDVWVVLDDDACLTDPGDLGRALDAFRRHPEAGLLAFKLVERYRGRERLLVPHGRRRIRTNPALADREGPVSHYLAGGHAVRKTVIRQCGLFRADLVYGHEELDLSYRVLDAGHRILYVPSVVVHHLPEADVPYFSSWKLYHSLRNRVGLAYTYLPWRYVPSHVGYWLAWYGVEALRYGVPGAYLRGLRDGVRDLQRRTRRPLRPEAVAYLRTHGGRLWR